MPTRYVLTALAIAACSGGGDGKADNGRDGSITATGGKGGTGFDGGNWPDAPSGGTGGAKDASSDHAKDVSNDVSSGGASGAATGGSAGTSTTGGSGGTGGVIVCPTIQVTSAVYAANCGAPTTVNSVAAQCNGLAQCSYTLDYTIDPGFDPAFGCGKDMSINYDCVAGGSVLTSLSAYAPGEATGTVFSLGCPCN